MSSPHNVSLCGKQFDRPGHICAFFDSREQQYEVLSPYYKEGLDQGEQVVTIVDPEDESDHITRLCAHGIAAEDAVADGSLRVFTAEQTYTFGGRFSATRMYDMLQGALASAQRQGRKVRTSGVMGWSTQGWPGTTELMDYEARVNVLVPMYDCTLLCVYDLASISGQMVMDILRTHPFVIHGHHVLRNPYYVPPVEVLKEMLLEQGQGPELSAN